MTEYRISIPQRRTTQQTRFAQYSSSFQVSRIVAHYQVRARRSMQPPLMALTIKLKLIHLPAHFSVHHGWC